MNIYLTGRSGGIGSAIEEHFKEHTFVNQIQGSIDWAIFSHGFIGEDDIEETFRANTTFCIEVTKQLLPYLKKGVIYISSTSGIKGNTKFPIYSASKAALNSYAETMQRAHPELRFYALCPGPTDTKMWRSLGLEGHAQPPEAVANAVEHLMEGDFRAGVIITVRDSIIYYAN